MLLQIISVKDKKKPKINQNIIYPQNNKDDAILTKHPFELLRWSNDLPNITILMGYNSNEGLYGLRSMLKQNKMEICDNDLGRFIPEACGVDKTDSAVCGPIVCEMRDFYLNGKSIQNETIYETTVLLSDYHFVIDTFLTIALYARYHPKYGNI